MVVFFFELCKDIPKQFSLTASEYLYLSTQAERLLTCAWDSISTKTGIFSLVQVFLHARRGPLADIVQASLQSFKAVTDAWTTATRPRRRFGTGDGSVLLQVGLIFQAQIKTLGIPR